MTTKAKAAERDALRALRLAAQALHEDAKEWYIEDALRYMRAAIDFEEIGK